MARELHEGRMLAEQIEREQAKQRKSRMFNTVIIVNYEKISFNSRFLFKSL